MRLLESMNITKNNNSRLHHSEPILDDFGKNIMDRVFENLASIFPGWKQNFRSSDPDDPNKFLRRAKKEWIKAFRENDICTIEQIQRGFTKARKHNCDFLPSCGKFISWCKPSPEDLGWPGVQAAMKQCIDHRSKIKQGRPIIQKLCQIVDWFRINKASNARERQEADNYFSGVYNELLSSGYTEPVFTPHKSLTGAREVNDGLSEQQKINKKARDKQNIKNIKKLLEGKNSEQKAQR